MHAVAALYWGAASKDGGRHPRFRGCGYGSLASVGVEVYVGGKVFGGWSWCSSSRFLYYRRFFKGEDFVDNPHLNCPI